jgi:hypothetical protein
MLYVRVNVLSVHHRICAQDNLTRDKLRNPVSLRKAVDVMNAFADERLRNTQNRYLCSVAAAGERSYPSLFSHNCGYSPSRSIQSHMEMWMNLLRSAKARQSVFGREGANLADGSSQ